MNKKKNSRKLSMKCFSFFVLIFLLTTSLNANFSKSGNIVTDNKTSLEWQDNNDTNSTQYTWQEAIDYCEALNLDGYSDWRLPNINELKTIIDRNKVRPSIVNGFEYVGIDNVYSYWSSSSVKNEEGYAWIVSFRFGSIHSDGKYDDHYVRCIRDGE